MAKLPTIKIALIKKHASDEDGYIKIKVYLPGNGIPKIKSTKWKVPVKYWDAAEQRVKKSYHLAETINREAGKERDKLMEQFEQDLKQNVNLSPTLVERRLKSDVGGNFLLFYKDYIKYLRTRFSEKYCNHFQTEYNMLVKFGGENLSFTDITAGLLEQYEVGMAGKAATTKNTKFKRLKEVVYRAIDRGLMDKKQIAGYSWPEYVNPERKYLTLDKVKELAAKIYAGEYTGDEPRLKTACYFLMACCSGLRVSDWPRFVIERLIDGEALKVRAQKNKEPIYIYLEDSPMLRDIANYIQANNIVFDITDQESNRELKQIRKDLKLPSDFKLTNHIARHTAATLLAERGFSAFRIGEVLGISEKTAGIYRHTTKQGLRNEYRTLGGL